MSRVRDLAMMKGCGQCRAAVKERIGQVAVKGKMRWQFGMKRCTCRAVTADGFCHMHGDFAQRGEQAVYQENKP